MPKCKISERKMIDVICKRGQGLSVGALAKEFNVNPSTIRRCLALYDKEGLIGSRKIKRKLKLNSNDKEKLEKYIRDFPFSSLEEIKQTLNLSYCTKSIANYCKSFGLKRGITPKKFYIKPYDCESRLIFARRRLYWSKDIWKKIIFTDVSGIDRFSKETCLASAEFKV